ncbi:uncharacterized protein LOC118181025 [Stegodyphus dumicola]|uniref:uncharacterized protein LOC118181025 n=1 Tax=Stegodyphus dumicola TaxID=202533 RepID=UPI0015AEE0A5|nr:uncharacterized protein LOC118181025 [Stegodyphus dumicola]
MFGKMLAFIGFCLASLLHVPVHSSFTVPAEMLSPLGVPGAMGPAGMTAVKLAVGSRLLNMIGTLGVGSTGSLASSLLGSQKGPQQLFGGGIPGFPQITPKSKEFSKRRGPNIPTSFNIREATPAEIENFFGVLHRVDANKCISRLVCEIGSNPKVLEGLGHNIKDVMGSLRVLEKNALSTKYRQIMLQGQKNGAESCVRNFSTCDQKSYRLIRTFVRAFRVRQ